MLQLQFVILPIVTVVLLAVAGLLLWLYFRLRRDTGRWTLIGEKDWTHGGLCLSGSILGSFGGFALITTLIMMVPFNPTYWTYNHVEGSVASVTNRFVGGTGDLSGDYVLRLDGESGVFNVQDNRIQGVKIGDHVDLTCTVQWVYAGQDQNNCFIRSWR